MSKQELDETDEKPLDPEVEKVRRKMVRLLVVSIGIMILGVMTVLAAVVYRIAQSDETPAAVTAGSAPFDGAASTPIAARANLPAGFSVDDVALDGGRILFFGEDETGQTRAYVFDIAAGRIVADVTVGQ
ncbi:hypothetical protein [Pararhizobium haloflavum]|uniref:hypothetical protein n=1 Tax=Pararhizobium haloflavum TaxID=2037914 RepID=UPI000C19CE06|nr:hypothetical protein [Pararhizobium haloflavum]